MVNSSANCYPDLKLEKFARLVGEVVGAGTPCVLFNKVGSLIWTSCPTHSLDVAGILGAVARMRSDDPSSCELEIHDPTYHDKVICRALSSRAEEEIGLLSIVLTPDCEPVVVTRAKSLLSHICESLLNELELNQELNQMAEELGARYEELNLIYSIEDKVKKYNPESGREAIEQLVEDCARHLDVDAVIFSVCDETYEMCYAGDPRVAGDEIWPGLERPDNLGQTMRKILVVEDHENTCPGSAR